MKKTITLTLSCLLGLSMTNAQTFSDDFESYTVGAKLGPQSPNWATWSGAGGGTDDVNVVSTDNHTVGGAKSIYFSSTSATGGPSDCILPFNATPISTGNFTFTAWFKIPTGKDAYFNFQGTATFGNMYTLDCWMNKDGSVSIQNSGAEVLTSTHPFGAWFELSIDANLNTNTWKLNIDGVSQGTWHNANNQVYAIDIYPADASAKYWVDDVSYNVVPYTTIPAVDGAPNFITIANGLSGQSKPLSVTIRNLGTTPITSFDISVDQNNGTPTVQNITGVNIASLATYTVSFPAPYTLLSGANNFRAIISNVNGLGVDANTSDDTFITTLTPLTPATGKMVVAEEGTGTWCQWCPRGAVYMDRMKNNYEGYFAGIAVHNNDIMTNITYDAGIGALITGYPTALIDRLPGLDPSAMENDIRSRLVIAPKVFIVNGATYNSITRELKISITSTVQQTLTGDYTLSCVLTEDSVHGTSTSYNQSNAYAGGGSGVMGGFETLPNPVPAAQMNYNHVARSIKPSFEGQWHALVPSQTIGQTITWNFTDTLGAAWNVNKINIIGIVMDPTGKIDNASSSTIAQAVTNGYISGTNATGITQVDQPDTQISLYPNPTSSHSTITLNLDKESTVSVAIYEVNGALVAKKEYGKLSGGMLLPIEMANFGKGMYFVNITIDGKTSIKKLVKE